MIDENRLLGAAVAALLLAACTQKPAPRPPIKALEAAIMAPISLCMHQWVAQAIADRPSPARRLAECSTHANRALDILSVRCRALPPVAEPPEDGMISARQPEDPAPDEQLVHLCAVLPWQDRSALARLL
jgi:hypothetical protein